MSYTGPEYYFDGDFPSRCRHNSLTQDHLARYATGRFHLRSGTNNDVLLEQMRLGGEGISTPPSTTPQRGPNLRRIHSKVLCDGSHLMPALRSEEGPFPKAT
ncbi:hypothetical protein AC579_4763 [Pseudocercospora musae]|uniref:Uncharacterized protein n=1 Tax=Pseudocercospora musae TaxID=113226 RepID=A0A139IQQ0_9PEZI|nr:hypothetical protein AC579_4763 [Pseudocercospora musae]